MPSASAPESSDIGYIVHHRRLRETSLIVHCLTRAHGLVSLVARGVRANKRTRHCVLEFTSLQLGWSGRSNLPNLVRSEPLQASLMLHSERLLSALYLNELVMRFVHRGDANERAFHAYGEALGALAAKVEIEPVLREFEITLLESCGYGMVLELATDTEQPIEAQADYFYVPDQGPLRNEPFTRYYRVSGVALLCLAKQAAWTLEAARAAKHLMRFVLHYHLGGRELASRKLWSRPATAAAVGRSVPEC